MHPGLSVPCSISPFVYTHLSQVHGHVIQPSHSWSSSSSCCMQLSISYLHHFPWLQHGLNVPCAKCQVRDSGLSVWSLSQSGIHYVPRLVVGFRDNYFLQGEFVSFTPNPEHLSKDNRACFPPFLISKRPLSNTVIPRLTKIIRSGITFVRRNLR